jgi:hypothetical protein
MTSGRSGPTPAAASRQQQAAGSLYCYFMGRVSRLDAMSVKDHSIVQKVLRRLRRHGVANTLHLTCLKLINLVVSFRILRAFRVERPNLQYMSCPPGYATGFASAAELARFARDPQNELSPQFIANALRAGDKCYAIVRGDELAAYGWCSTRPTPVGLPGLVLHFRSGYAYRYKGFTAVQHRGKRLHAVGITHTLLHFLAKGSRGLVLYVESTNLDSLKSCRRTGCEMFGSIYVVGILGRYFTFASPGCKDLDFRIEQARQENSSAVSKPLLSR